MVRSTFKIARVWIGIIVFLGVLLFGLDLVLVPKPLATRPSGSGYLPGRKEKGFVLTWHPDQTTEEGMDTFKGNPLHSQAHELWQ